ncbi:hypothetical protein FGL95_08605 [Nocardiaceae bacterium YC2-7]|uniref:Uncharacterized protein n=2 Tax=Antrihabitans stalactiti TaxID=2584121 RepID=A0A848KD53_9NOCA|nr:hypothetical protein [Antrihabitans stalactiti]
MLTAAAVAFPYAASADPESAPDPKPIGNSGSSAVDFGSSVIDGGSGIMNACVQDPGSCVGRIIDGGSSALGAGVGVLFGGSSNGGLQNSQPCNQSTKSGGPGVTTTTHSIGRSGPTSFDLSWDTEDVPDDIVVIYEGVPIADTGYVGGQKGTETGVISVNVPPGGASTVTVRVTGPSGTLWAYTVHCPR